MHVSRPLRRWLPAWVGLLSWVEATRSFVGCSQRVLASGKGQPADDFARSGEIRYRIYLIWEIER